MTLKYVDCAQPGFTRRRVNDKFRYYYPDGKLVTNSRLSARLDAIALPPAYTSEWYALDERSHILATGIDERGRKQYRYHPAYRDLQDQEKYAQCPAFGRALPSIRAAVETDLARRDLSMERVVAAVVRLLDLGSVRVGNARYARENKSYGATTMTNRHAGVAGTRVKLQFVGKSGKMQNITIADGKLARVVRRCLDTPGQLLFQYDDGDGGFRPVESCDVNAYLRRHGGEFTAKTFRTWSGSAIAFGAWAEAGVTARIQPVMERVAAQLGNTPAIARKSYVHPAIIDAITDRMAPPSPLPRSRRYLGRNELGLLRFLDERG